MRKTSNSTLVRDVTDFGTNDIRSFVREYVSAYTGMSEKELLNDTKEYYINNLDKAVDEFAAYAKTAIGKNPTGTIKIYTDYDVDGIGCAYNLHQLCKSIGARHEVYLPDRESDGYGIKERHAEQLLKPGDMLICADNGIAAHDAIRKAKEIGCKVIVLDHHEGYIGEDGNIRLPDADVIVDPCVTGADYTDYCGAALCYKFAERFYETRIGEAYRYDNNGKAGWQKTLDKINVFAAISTITDSVNLTGENRRIVRDGFRKYREGAITEGMRAIAKALWMPKVRQLSGDDIGFTLGPALNACGRLLPNGAQYVYDTVAYDGTACVQLDNRAKKIQETNDTRKNLTKKYRNDDFGQIDDLDYGSDGVIVTFRDGTIPGLDGIRAGKIAEEYGAVSFVFSRDESNPHLLKGSGRTAGDIDIKHLLDQISHLLLTYGGHKEACGLQLDESCLGAFRKEVNRLVSKSDISIDENVHWDIEINADDVPELIDAINEYGPFGTGCPPIKVYVKDLEIQPGYLPKSKDGSPSEYRYYMGKELDSFKALDTRGNTIVGFSIADEFRNAGEPGKISFVGTVGQDEKMGAVIPRVSIDTFTMDIEERMHQRNMEKNPEK